MYNILLICLDSKNKKLEVQLSTQQEILQSNEQRNGDVGIALLT